MVFLLSAEAGLPMYYFNLVYVVGFVAAVSIGSIAWYNSKRPPGWENAERPDFVPKVDAPEGVAPEDDAEPGVPGE